MSGCKLFQFKVNALPTIDLAGFEVLTAVLMNVAIFWAATSVV
jgi:hypothetical protein